MADARTGAAGEAVLLADDAHAVRSGIDGVDGAYTLAGPAGDAGIFVDAPGAQSRAGTQAQEASEGADAVVPEGLFKKEGNEGGEGREYGQDWERRARSLYDNHEGDKEGEEDGGNKDAEKAFRVAVLRWLHEWPPPTAERTDVT